MIETIDLREPIGHRTVYSLHGNATEDAERFAAHFAELTGIEVIDSGSTLISMMHSFEIPTKEQVSFIGGEYGYFEDQPRNSNNLVRRIPLDFLSKAVLSITTGDVITTNMNSMYDFAALGKDKGVNHVPIRLDDGEKSLMIADSLHEPSEYERLVSQLEHADSSAGVNYRWMLSLASFSVRLGRSDRKTKSNIRTILGDSALILAA